MKAIIYLVSAYLLILANGALAQTNQPSNKPLYYVEGTIINHTYFDFIQPDSIKEIHVIKKDDEHPNGAIYISLKNPDYLKRILADKLLSIKDILLKKGIKAKKNQSLIFFLDGNLLTDTTNVRVPENYLGSVNLIPAANMPYFKTALPNTSLIYVNTKKYRKNVMVRGGEVSR